MRTPPLQRLDDDGPLRALTAREREIAGLVAAGCTNQQIADRLSVRTVGNHLNHIYSKVGVSDRSQLSELVRPSALTTGGG